MCQIRCLHVDDVARTRDLLHDQEIYQRLADLFGALADPTRAKIIHSMLCQELCSCDLAARLCKLDPK
jgi:ArsR family transcriptional regulator, lead/cadmium/zinc/bismuth-responsive transcriptional repressor